MQAVSSWAIDRGIMARINVEDSWWTDPRRYELADALGSIRLADGLALEVWRMSQQFWGNGRRKIPLQAFKQIPEHQILFDKDLAVCHGNFVYIRGTKQFHEWYALSKEHGAKGGKSKANRLKRTPSEVPSESLTSSSSSSSSSSSKTKNNTIAQEHAALETLELPLGEDRDQIVQNKFDFEALYKKYPRKEGRERGLAKCRAQIKTQADYDALSHAIDRYTAANVKRGTLPDFYHHFSTFMGFWRDCLDENYSTVDLRRDPNKIPQRGLTQEQLAERSKSMEVKIRD